jgi:two-component system sensor kinase FixL
MTHVSRVSIEVTRDQKTGTKVEMLKQRAELAHLNRVVTTGQLAASIAHELNQPLMAIMTNAATMQKLLEARGSLATEAREIVADILEDARRAADIIQHMLTFLRKHELVEAPVMITDLIAETMHLVGHEAAARKVCVRFDAPNEPPCVMGDRVLLQQVMMNLVLNAFEAMRSAPEDARRLTICSRTGNGTVNIDVSDTGTGIPCDVLSRVFEPFQTSKKDGLGIGLSISRAIVDAHGGQIWAENNSDRGATFHVVLIASPAFSAPSVGSD